MAIQERLVQIGTRLVGDGQPCYVIAEAGINHNGSLAVAKQLADAARDAGADAIKFQKRRLSEVYQRRVLDDPRLGEQSLQYMVPLLTEFELSDDQFHELAAYCRQKGIEFLCTPWDRSSVDLLEALDVAAYKISSPDMTNLPLIEYVADTGKPFIISTGMSTEDEIRMSLAFVEQRGARCIVMHCVSAYPVAPDEVNLRFMQRLRQWCPWPVGYSGHEDGIAISTAAVVLGAVVVERHITLNRAMRGLDHRASLEPARFHELVAHIREVEASLGVAARWISRGEILNRRVLGKSLVARVDLPAGTTIGRDMVTTKSPGMGLSPQKIDRLVGRQLRRDMQQDDMFLESDLATEVDEEPAGQVIALGVPWGVVARLQDLDALVERFQPQGMAFAELHLSDRDLDAYATLCPTVRYPLGLVVHAPEYCHDSLIDLCADDESQRQLSVSRIQRTLDAARAVAHAFDVGDPTGPKVVIHVGGMSRDPRHYDLAAATERLCQSLRELDTTGVQLLLENLPPRPWFFGGRWAGHVLVTAENTADVCRRTGYDLCFDTSHAALACAQDGRSLADFVRTVSPFIRHLHVSDGAGTSGEGLQIAEGNIDFVRLWPLLVETGATCVPEIWMGHHNGGIGFQTALNRLSGSRGRRKRCRARGSRTARRWTSSSSLRRRRSRRPCAASRGTVSASRSSSTTTVPSSASRPTATCVARSWPVARCTPTSSMS